MGGGGISGGAYNRTKIRNRFKSRSIVVLIKMLFEFQTESIRKLSNFNY